MSNSWATFIALYLRIGLLGFGGPQAHIAMLREEIVQTRGWVDAGRFDEGLGLCEALPGPASSQMAIYLGWQQRGWIGGRRRHQDECAHQHLELWQFSR